MFGKKKKVKHEKHHTDYKVSSENLAMPELHIGEGRSEKAPEERKDEFITYENVAFRKYILKRVQILLKTGKFDIGK